MGQIASIVLIALVGGLSAGALFVLLVNHEKPKKGGEEKEPEPWTHIL